jgi:exodeoxyribonuclease V beta subunit
VQSLNVLNLPLRGQQVIEASAGTGKTYTLAALYVRLVLGHGRTAPLLPPQILVMTFTEAATAELRARIRERLAGASAFFRASALNAETATTDGFLRDLRSSIAAELWLDCAHRLALAAQWMDDAAVFTIHGWSQRMLREHAFESASLFDQEVLTDPSDLHRAVARDYWRRWMYPMPPDAVALVQKVAADPDVLLKKVQSLWQQWSRQPAEALPAGAAPEGRATITPATPATLAQAAADWTATERRLDTLARAAFTPAWRAALDDAATAKALTGYRANHLPGWLNKLDSWMAGADIDPKTLERFGQAKLGPAWKNPPATLDFATLAPLDDWVAHRASQPHIEPDLLFHAAHAMREDVQRRKEAHAQFGFDDLLHRLYHAVRQPDGAMAAAIRRQYPVALVDEFQDTDPWQYGALEVIYGQHDKAIGAQETATLLMIGDPKQAIYSFRGADLPTYLRARDQAEAIHTLSHNFRSAPPVVAAVNHIFQRASAPFGRVPYVEVSARRTELELLQYPDGTQAPALTVWHPEDFAELTQAQYQPLMARHFAERMAHWVQTGKALPGHMAVLVRSAAEAQVVRRALSAAGLRSVFLSEKRSVFATQEAEDLWRLLHAVHAAHTAEAGSALRAALATRTWGLPWQALHALQTDEPAWEHRLEQLQQWQLCWQQQGVLALVLRWLHEENLPAQLFRHAPRQAERRLTNLLQLAELLQQAAARLHGPAALLRHLERLLQDPASAGDSAPLRLESDEQLVQVITMHKSKGLEYPLVFLPFVSGFHKNDGAAGAQPTPGSSHGGAGPWEGEGPTEAAEVTEAADDPDASALPEADGEGIRLLYVALTRAQRGIWVGVAPLKGDFKKDATEGKSALSRLLGRQSAHDLPQCLARWAECEHIRVESVGVSPGPSAAPATVPQHGTASPPSGGQAVNTEPGANSAALPLALTPRRRHRSSGWTASFSALVRPTGTSLASEASNVTAQDWQDQRWDDAWQDAQVQSLDQQEEADTGPDPQPASGLIPPPIRWNDFPAGARYGTLLHDLLEWQAQEGWPLAQTGEAASQATRGAASDPTQYQRWQQLLANKALACNLSAADATLLQDWLPRVVSQQFAAVSLGQLQAGQYWPEMSFTFAASQLEATRLDQTLRQHLRFSPDLRDPLPARRLQGWLTGFMDLVFVHGGRYYVLDYKSNRLAGYHPAALEQAIQEHRYDVQLVLYVLALHRLLRARLPAYDYDQHMGGGLYWFVRGLDAPGAGVWQALPPRALIESLDRQFAARTEEPA